MNLQELLDEHDITQAALAKEIDVHFTQVSRWCIGRNKPGRFYKPLIMKAIKKLSKKNKDNT